MSNWLSKAQRTCGKRRRFEEAHWVKPRRSKTIELETDLLDHLSTKEGYEQKVFITEPQQFDEKLPGFMIYLQRSHSRSEIPPQRNIGYRCGACNMGVLGSPEIKSGKRKGTLQYDCTRCDAVLDVFDGRINTTTYEPNVDLRVAGRA